MDLQNQRAGDLARSAGRSHAIEVGRKTRGIFSRYVSSRRAQVQHGPVTEVRWARVLLVLAAAALGVVGLVHLVR